tara:strand:- start:982 stop:1179 length:198 start_codon:yes stop_codon:yes gene_type:complete
MKDRVIYFLAIGILTLLTCIIIGDFIVSFEDGRPIDDGIINLMQVTITGLIGIIGTYFGMKNGRD